MVVAIDERTLKERGSMRNVRLILAEALDEIATAKPKAVALDVTLPDATEPAVDARLEAALRATRNLVLPCQSIIAGSVKKWEDPLPRFRTLAQAVGHVDHKRDADGVNREIPLEELEGNDQRWALAIEAFAVATIVARRYGNHRWIPYVAYGAAALVGFSRLSLSAHFLSDVFMGGALGYSISRFTVLRQ